jgi:formylglycine-generating enzyme
MCSTIRRAWVSRRAAASDSSSAGSWLLDESLGPARPHPAVSDQLGWRDVGRVPCCLLLVLLPLACSSGASGPREAGAGDSILRADTGVPSDVASPPDARLVEAADVPLPIDGMPLVDAGGGDLLVAADAGPDASPALDAPASSGPDAVEGTGPDAEGEVGDAMVWPPDAMALADSAPDAVALGDSGRADVIATLPVEETWGLPPGPSCTGLATLCQGESCCANRVVPAGSVPLGTSFRDPASLPAEQPEHDVLVSSFALDKYEVTVGRFRRFVDSYTGQSPAEGAGANPNIPGSGWRSDRNQPLPTTREGLMARLKCDAKLQTWTDQPGANEAFPINCVDWDVAFAFCAWDEGRLPTEAEWEYAAAGGVQNRRYPWGSEVDPALARYTCSGCSATVFAPVGARPLGAARWGHLDMAGGIAEATMDAYSSTAYSDRVSTSVAYQVINPLNPMSSSLGAACRGGAWTSGDSSIRSASRLGCTKAPAGTGIRCARDGSSTCGPGTIRTVAATPTTPAQCSSCPSGQTSVGLDALSCRAQPRISAGSDYTCMVKTDGRAECWGANAYQQTRVRLAHFAGLSSGNDHTCGLDVSGTPLCWGCANRTETLQMPLLGGFVASSTGAALTCGVRTDRSVDCWASCQSGSGGYVPPHFDGPVRDVAVGDGQVCALMDDGTLTCWSAGSEQAPTPPAGAFTALSVRGPHACGIKIDQSIVCWGRFPLLPPAGNFKSIAVGEGRHGCGIKSDGSTACWTIEGVVPLTPPGNVLFTEIATGGEHACGLTTSGSVVCWGDNASGQATPPAGL